MIIRYADIHDFSFIASTIERKGMDYNTVDDVREDINAGRLIVAVEDGKIIGSVAIVYKAHRGYTAIMRMCVYAEGRGVASALIDYILSLGLGNLGATPWDDNPVMCHIFEKRGFVYRYTFKKNYKFYEKNA